MSTSGPDHSPAAAASTAKNTTLPIARSSGTAYERPERARTSHACEPCRERKTKCDGERPSCRRCLHTGTSCHYGYGKGWRKRKTAEDLTTTSRRLARYETLLSDIMPMVTPNVRAMIEEAREHDMTPSTGSETTENDTPRSQPSISSDISSSTTSTRLPLPLPVPTSNIPSSTRPSTVRSFDSIASAPTSNPVLHPSPPGLMSDDATGRRLPSITPQGMLIEPLTKGSSPTHLSHTSDSQPYAKERLVGLPSVSPPYHSSYGELPHHRSGPG